MQKVAPHVADSMRTCAHGESREDLSLWFCFPQHQLNRKVAVQRSKTEYKKGFCSLNKLNLRGKSSTSSFNLHVSSSTTSTEQQQHLFLLLLFDSWQGVKVMPTAYHATCTTSEGVSQHFMTDGTPAKQNDSSVRSSEVTFTTLTLRPLHFKEKHPVAWSCSLCTH